MKDAFAADRASAEQSMTAPTLSEQKRAAILAAALQAFEARGFRETSMDQIAKAAGVSKRTVYNHFASKDALFRAITAALSERVAQVTDYRYDPALSLHRQLRTIGGQVLDMLVSPDFVTLSRVALVEMLRSPDLARETYNLVRERQTGLARWLSDATRDDRLEIEDAVWAADLFLGLIKSFAFWPQILGGQPVPDAAIRERILDSAVELFLGCYGKAP